VAILLALIVGTTLCAIAPAEGATRTSVVARIWTEPQAGYGFIDAAIEDAHASIDLSMYELSDPSIERALVGAAHHGVDVRVILNAAYEGSSENATAASVLRKGSVHVVWAPSNQIFHAK
jgi:phosphatidylserine/phosphatidylglycerophosphate/cardiolipin synthase-like enzyme